MRMKLFAATIFWGSFISFALEPMIGRALLPVFGGTPMVWVTCLGAFQLLMVGGYLYAEKGGSTAHIIRHVFFLCFAGIWCCALSFSAPFILDKFAMLTGIGGLDVLVAVLALVGFAFILLAANATIIQSLSGGNYRLYAISNVGSLLGLFSYPILVEPFVGLSTQWLMLGGAILLYAFLVMLSSRIESPNTIARQEKTEADIHKPYHRNLYLIIPAVSCALLNAVTTHLTLDVAPLPLLWAILLGIFLISYVIGFSGRFKSVYFAPLSIVSVVAAYWWTRIDTTNSINGHLIASSVMLFLTTTFLHTWLYEIRPSKSYLARYYLFNVIGGATGGILMSIVAPLIFNSVLEYPIILFSSAAMIIIWTNSTFKNGRIFGIALSLICIMVFALAHLIETHDPRGAKVIHRARGFFGTVRVSEVLAKSSDGKNVAIHEFYHGETVHGIQVMRKELEKMPTCYFTPYGVGYSIWGHPNYKDGKPRRVNLLGLGIGVLYAYGRNGDYYRAYEISPETLSIAQSPQFFTYVPHSSAKVDIALGDARKGLEQELANNVEPYDVLIIDAFTGDHLPYHLSTKEAIELYLKLLKPDGILCINITNKHLDLKPYIKRIGLDFGIEPVVMKSKPDEKRIGFSTDSAFFCRRPDKLRRLPVDDGFAFKIDITKVKPLDEMPTDDKGSFLPLVRLW